jgi:EAL domain-containing protein (putative c-di-GMP-specific phosphodiesterase class I)
MPQQFLPGSEQSGFIGAIGIYVIEQALRQYRYWLNQGLQIPSISINLYQSQLDTDLPDVLLEKCQKYALDHQQVCLEFSESNFKIINHEQREVLHQLQDMQFKLCIDDFGRSLNSLSFLVECAVQVMKIDPQLIRQALNSADAEGLLKGFVSFCESQQIRLVAEGVESEKDSEYLRGLHITHMQGYLFSRPLAARDVAGYLEQL